MNARGLTWLAVAALVLGAPVAFVELAPVRVLAALPAWAPHPGRSLGLKELGGVTLALSPDQAALRADTLAALKDQARETLRAQQIDFSGLGIDGSAEDGGAVIVRVSDPAQLTTARASLATLSCLDGGWTGSGVRLTSAPDGALRLGCDDHALTAEVLRRASPIVARRLAAAGARSPSVKLQGERIIADAPGVTDVGLLKRYLGVSAKLNFRLVDQEVSAEDMLSGHVPPDDEMLASDAGPVAVKRRVVVGGAQLTAARGTVDQFGRPAVAFIFDHEGGRLFGEATTRNVGRRLAIVLDGRILSVPVIVTPITRGSGIITGNFTTEGAHDLGVLLQSGALPTPLRVVEAHVVPAG